MFIDNLDFSLFYFATINGSNLKILGFFWSFQSILLEIQTSSKKYYYFITFSEILVTMSEIWSS